MYQQIVHIGGKVMVAASVRCIGRKVPFRPIADHQPKRSSVHPQGRSEAEEAPQAPCTVRERRLAAAIVECFYDLSVETNLELLGGDVGSGLHILMGCLGR